MGIRIVKETPLLRWVGGKRRLVDQIISSIPNVDWGETDYCEPFLGSGALLLKVQSQTPTKANNSERIASDINSSLISAHRVVRDSPHYAIDFVNEAIGVINKLDKISQIKYYRELVNSFNNSINKGSRNWKLQGSRMLLLNRLCFNGVFRLNSAGLFNVPLGSPSGKSKNYSFSSQNLLNNHYLLQGVKLATSPYQVALRKILKSDKKTVVYLDPPYADEGTTFVDYKAGSFSWKDQLQLAKIAEELVERGHIVIVSNGSITKITDLYCPSTFAHSPIERYMSVSGGRRGRGKIGEMLAIGGEIAC